MQDVARRTVSQLFKRNPYRTELQHPERRRLVQQSHVYPPFVGRIGHYIFICRIPKRRITDQRAQAQSFSTSHRATRSGTCRPLAASITLATLFTFSAKRKLVPSPYARREKLSVLLQRIVTAVEEILYIVFHYPERLLRRQLKEKTLPPMPATPPASSARRSCLGRNVFQHIEQMVPEFLNRRDQHALVGRMNAPQRRTERHHIERRIFFEEQAALQSGVNGLHLRLCPEQPLVAFHGYAQDFGRRIRLPSRITVGCDTGCSAQFESGAHRLRHVFARRQDGAALAGDNNDLPVFLLDRSQIGRRFHQSRMS